MASGTRIPAKKVEADLSFRTYLALEVTFSVSGKSHNLREGNLPLISPWKESPSRFVGRACWVDILLKTSLENIICPIDCLHGVKL